MSKNRSSSNNKLKCTFVDPVKGACRVTVLDQDRLIAHFNRTHRNIPEDIAFECNLCPFATGSIKRLNLHRIQHAGNKNVSCETPTSIPDTNCYDQLRQPSDQEKEEITSEIEFDFGTEIQSSDDSKIADLNPIAGITNHEAGDVAQTLIVIQLGESNNSDADLLELQNTEKVQVSVSNTNRRKSKSPAKPDLDSSLTATVSDSSLRIGRPPKVKRAKPLKKGTGTRETSNLVKKTKGHQAQNEETNKPFKNPENKRKYLKCTFVDPVKGECKVRALNQDGLDAHINRFHKSDADAHIKRHHQKIPGGKYFRCNLCPFATGDMKYLVLHRKRHAGIKDVTCEICGRSYYSKEYLVKHKRAMHDEPYPVHCNICGKGCHDSHGLKMHNYQNHWDGEFTHRCHVCNEGFYSLPQLSKHMVKHAERTFKCDECPKAFRTKALLKRHVETHTGIRPFACDLCNWKFYTQQKLDLHHSIHTNKRPFLCQECGFSSRSKDLLKSHLKVHENNKSLAEKGIKKLPRLAKPRNRRLKSFDNTVPPTLPIATQTTTEISAKIITQQVESEMSKE